MKKIIYVVEGIILVACITFLIILVIKHNKIQANYDISISNYNNLYTEYQSLKKEYEYLNSAKDDLQDKYDTLCVDYNTLHEEYNKLQILYDAETAVTYETPTVLSEYATDIAYEDIARTPDDYEGRALCYTGEVIQVLETDGETDLRIALDDWYEDVLLCGYDPKITDKRILEGDTVTVYGIYYGIYTYESTIGASVSLPLLWLDHIEIN